MVSSTGIGISICRGYEQMTGELKELISFSGIVKGQLRYAMTELTEIMEEGQGKTTGVISEFLHIIADRLHREEKEGFTDIWKEGLIYLREYGHLTDIQLDMVKKLGTILGYMDASAQVVNIEIWEKNLLYEYEKQREHTERIKKVACSLGILGGMLILIILL
jgi:stage III sporulation protein AB